MPIKRSFAFVVGDSDFDFKMLNRFQRDSACKLVTRNWYWFQIVRFQTEFTSHLPYESLFEHLMPCRLTTSVIFVNENENCNESD